MHACMHVEKRGFVYLPARISARVQCIVEPTCGHVGLASSCQACAVTGAIAGAKLWLPCRHSGCSAPWLAASP